MSKDRLRPKQEQLRKSETHRDALPSHLTLRERRGAPGGLAGIGSRNGDRMCGERLDSSEKRLRIAVETHLLQHASAIVVDAFTGELPVLIEHVETAEREIHASTGRRKTAP